MTGSEEQSVLRLRLATLRRNLEQVSATASSVAHRRNEVDALAELFEEQDGVQGTGGSLVRDIEECQKTVDELSRIPQVSLRLVDRLRHRLVDCERSVTDILNRAKRSENIVRAMSSRWDTLGPDEKFDDHIKEIFAHRATGLIKEIDKLAATLPAEAWTSFQREIRAESEDLFSEYVEFLGGVALRDTGLGAPGASADNAALNGGTGEVADRVGPDVYAMADDLVKQIYRIGGGDMWHSVTIPARRDAAARTLARMIRLRFPEWTVWAVPLAAYEFGRVVVNELDLVDAYATGFGGVEQGLETLLADVFAAYAMGPAYAFASVYVLLDPRAEGQEKLPDSRAEGREKLTMLERSPVRSDSERAYVVLRALELMDSGGALSGVIGDLRARWQMAVDQAQGVALPSGGEAETLDRIAEFLADHLREHALTIGYSASRWQIVQRWGPLGELLDDPRWRLTVGKEDVRDILNAAWLQRLNTDKPLDAVADAELADAALTLWRHDLEGRRPGGSGIGQRWRK